MVSYLLAEEAAADQENLLVEGMYVPDQLTNDTGVYIVAAGSMMLVAGTHDLKPRTDWVWLCVDKDCTLQVERAGSEPITLNESESCVLPIGEHQIRLLCDSDCRCLWMSMAGNLAPTFLERMGMLLHAPMKQVTLPSQLYLIRQIVQVIVRHDQTADANYQLQHLLWGMLASHSGQPVAMNAMLSHEIAKVVDALQSSKYKINFSLAEMAEISRMPVETFRKRFVAEVGMPPLSYLLYFKMERAKELLQQQMSVRQAGVEVGMKDPYHFSKQFKSIVGISPSFYMKQVRQTMMSAD